MCLAIAQFKYLTLPAHQHDAFLLYGKIGNTHKRGDECSQDTVLYQNILFKKGVIMQNAKK